jgi:hypothetical protein
MNVHSSTAVPNYMGEAIDLTTYKISTLYQASINNPVGSNLDVREIYDIASKNHDVWYLTLSFNVSETVLQKNDIWLQLRTNISATEVIFNDQLLLRNGSVNNEVRDEVTGQSILLHQLPNKQLKVGINRFVVKFSNYKNKNAVIFRDFSIGKKEQFQNKRAVMSLAPLVFFGVFVFAVLINLALYFSLNKPPMLLLFPALFTLTALLMVIEVLYWNGWLDADSIIDTYDIKRWLHWGSYLFLLLIVHTESKSVNSQLIIPAILICILPLIDYFSQYDSFILISLMPLIYSIYCYRNNKVSSLLFFSLCLLTVFNLLDEFNILEQQSWVYSNPIINSLVFKLDNLGMVIVAVALIFNVSSRVIKNVKALSDAELNLERLEYQLMTKNIQPHFLMNSLMSLQQLVEQKDPNACLMIEALSDDFGHFMSISKKKLINIEQEIEICRNYLHIMSMQHRSNHQLIVEGFSGEEEIPPALFHTLIENGITHGFQGIDSAKFVLTKCYESELTRFSLTNNGKNDQRSRTRKSSGSGLEYVKSRLEEWQQDNWALQSCATEQGWETIIEIRGRV